MTDIETYCLSLPSAAVERPFGPTLQTFKVGGKIFAILSDDASLTFKASEIGYELLREQGRARRAPYLPRGGWLNIEHTQDWDRSELFGLIAQSHARVVAGLTRKTRQELGLAG